MQQIVFLRSHHCNLYVAEKKTEMKELKDMAKKSTKTLLEGLFKDTIGDRQLKIEFTK